VNDTTLRAIAYQTTGHFEGVSTNAARIMSGLDQEFVITNIRPIVRDDGDLSELLVDESFVTVPDWRLTTTWWPFGKSGGFISGTLPRNRDDHPTALEFSVTSTKSLETRLFVAPVPPPEKELAGESGRLIGLMHCKQVMDEARMFRIDPIGVKHFVEEVAIRYNIASDFTTLLLLHQAQQFIDNELECPATHPAHREWAALRDKLVTNDEIRVLTKKCAQLEKQQSIAALGTKLLSYQLNGLTAIEKRERNEAKAREEAAQAIAHETRQLWEDAMREVSPTLDNAVTQIESARSKLSSATQEIATQSSLLERICTEASARIADLVQERRTEISALLEALSTRVREASSPLDAEIAHMRSTWEQVIATYRAEFEPHLKEANDRELAWREALRAVVARQEESRQAALKEHNERLAQQRKNLEEAKARLAQVQREEAERREKKAQEEAANKSSEREAPGRQDDERRVARRCAPSSRCAQAADMCFSYSARSCGEGYLLECDDADEAICSSSVKPTMCVPVEPSVSVLKSQFDAKVTPVREKAREISRDVDAAVQQIDSTRQDFTRNVESAKSRMRAAIDRAAALQQSVEPRVQARTRELQDAQPVATANESYRGEMMRRRTRAGKLDKATKDAQLRPYLASIAKALEGDEPEHVRAARAYEEYLAAREKELTSPSFYIYSSRLFVAVRGMQAITITTIMCHTESKTHSLTHSLTHIIGRGRQALGHASHHQLPRAQCAGHADVPFGRVHDARDRGLR